MNEAETRAEIARRKDIFRREQAALPFTEKVRLAFALSQRRGELKQARIIPPQDAPLPSSSVTK
jgi:hypothetical protein